MEISEEFRRWLDELRHDIPDDELSIDPVKFILNSTHWKILYNEGLTPRQAWQRAERAYGQLRRQEDSQRAITSEDKKIINARLG